MEIFRCLFHGREGCFQNYIFKINSKNALNADGNTAESYKKRSHALNFSGSAIVVTGGTTGVGRANFRNVHASTQGRESRYGSVLAQHSKGAALQIYSFHGPASPAVRSGRRPARVSQSRAGRLLSRRPARLCAKAPELAYDLRAKDSRKRAAGAFLIR